MIGARSRSALLNLRRRRCTPFWGMRSWLRCAGAARASAAAARAPRSSFVEMRRRATALCFMSGRSSGCGAAAWTSGVRNLLVLCVKDSVRSISRGSEHHENEREPADPRDTSKKPMSLVRRTWGVVRKRVVCHIGVLRSRAPARGECKKQSKPRSPSLLYRSALHGLCGTEQTSADASSPEPVLPCLMKEPSCEVPKRRKKTFLWADS